MDRDRRLTGFYRGQSDRAVAPEGFELTNSWKVSFGGETAERDQNLMRSRFNLALYNHTIGNNRIIEVTVGYLVEVIARVSCVW
jgi:hypothetical protein